MGKDRNLFSKYGKTEIEKLSLGELYSYREHIDEGIKKKKLKDEIEAKQQV